MRIIRENNNRTNKNGEISNNKKNRNNNNNERTNTIKNHEKIEIRTKKEIII